MLKSSIKNISGIYAFRNKVDGKVYVGQSNRVFTRKKQHERSDTRNSRRFHFAMKKYGPNGFDWTVLEYCEKDKLNEREAYWVSQLNSLHPNGYNLTSGGGAFQKHHPETRNKFSKNQIEKIKSGTHIFLSDEFIKQQSLRQIELGKRGEHSSQRVEVREKRNRTVRERMEQSGKFFTHTLQGRNRIRKTQIEMDAQGLGTFQKPELIAKNRVLVKKKLEEGTHHTQQEGWFEKTVDAHRHEMKPVVLAIRTSTGETLLKRIESVHEAARILDAERRHLSSLCNEEGSVLTVQCNLGKIIKGNFGVEPDWDIEEIRKIPNSKFTRKMKVEVTITKFDGETVVQVFDGQREACRQLDASPRAFRGVLHKEKYKSTACNLGRIIKILEVEE